MNKRILISLFLLIGLSAFSSFAQTGKKITYGILFENSLALGPQMDNMKFIGNELVAQTFSKGVVSLYNFTEGGKSVEFNTLLGASQDQSKLESKIAGLHIARGKTTFYDGIEFASKKLTSKENDDSEKILIIVASGFDKNSTIKRDELLQNVKARNVKIFAVGLIESLPLEIDSKKDGKKGKINLRQTATEFLLELTRETGGRAIFPNAGENIRDLIKKLLGEYGGA